MQCANCGHDNPDNNKFCGECGQLLNDPHDVGRFSVLQSKAADRDALSASVDAFVDHDPAPFPDKEEVPTNYIDHWTPIDSERPRPATLHESAPIAGERTAYEPHTSSSVLGLTDPEPARPATNSYVAMESEPERYDTPLHGPSFLGLGGEEPEFSYEYQEPRSNARKWLALVFLLVLVALGALQWRSIKDGLRYSKEGILRITLPLRKKAPAPAPPADQVASATPSDASSGTPQMVVEPPPKSTTESKSESENPPSTTQNPPVASTAAVGDNNSPSEKSTGGAAAATDSKATTPSAEKSAAAEPTHTSSEDETPKPTAKPVETATAKPPRPAARREPPAEEPPQPAAGEAELKSALSASDPATQSSLLWKAVGKGNVDAQVRLADMYANGIGVSQNCDQAMLLLRSASAKPNVRARVKMGTMYASGKCVEQDRLQAYRWMSRALEVDPGSDWARTNRQSVWSQMSPQERSRAGR